MIMCSHFDLQSFKHNCNFEVFQYLKIKLHWKKNTALQSQGSSYIGTTDTNNTFISIVFKLLACLVCHCWNSDADHFFSSPAFLSSVWQINTTESCIKITFRVLSQKPFTQQLRLTLHCIFYSSTYVTVSLFDKLSFS